MDPPRIQIFHHHKFITSTNLLHPQLHNSNQISQLDFKQINWDDSKGPPVSHDVYLGCFSDTGQTWITEFTAACSHKKKFTL